MADIVNLSNKRILVVEDDDINYIYLSQIFKLTKGNITRSKNGKNTLEIVREQKFDVILMDIQLPDVSGNEVIRTIRKSDPETPIIAQTASRTPDETEASLDAGCNYVLTKPFTIDDFSKVLRRYIE